MAKNRLHLDFSLSSTEERNKFINEYVKNLDFTPTSDELEMMGNYVLWGKDSDGKNGVQRKEYQIETKSKTWDNKDMESLDELQESPTFNEAILSPITQLSARPKVVREVFDREKAKAMAPDYLKQELEDLFQMIDYYDLLIEFYDLDHGKRTKPIRESLLNKFSVEEIEKIRNSAASLNQFKYLKQKHLLVSLRQQQYCLSDNFMPTFTRQDYTLNILPTDARFDADIPVYPLGLKYDHNNLIFFSEDELCGRPYDNAMLKRISDIIQEHQRIENNTNPRFFFFDFTDMEHVYNLLLSLEDMKDVIDLSESDETTSNLIATMEFYIEFAELNELQKEILDLKMHKVRNPDIAKIINEKYNKSYTANYISTIFRQKIIKQINEGAEYHLRLVENLFYPENFKECNCCGKTYLIDPKNFVRKTRAKDGFANRCKKCDKDDRERRKGD